jgi:hypothetical protein
MAQWIKVKKNFDYRWPSGALTAFKKGQVVFVKDEVFKASGDWAEPTEKPDPEKGNPKPEYAPLNLTDDDEAPDPPAKPKGAQRG